MGSRSSAIAASEEDKAEWEVRPGGMLVQKREAEGGLTAPAGPMVSVNVSYGNSVLDVTVPAQFTFGDLKRVLAQNTGLEPQDQKLLFRGKEKDDGEFLHATGVKDGAKLVLLQDPAARERKVEQEQGRMDEGIARALEAIGRVRAEVDKLAAKVAELESAVNSGKKVVEKEFVVLTELLMVQLLKLDAIEADGEAREQRRAEVRRVQNLVDTLDKLKARNANPFSDNSKTVSVSTQWETFNSGLGSLNAPPPRVSSTQATTDWEQFE